MTYAYFDKQENIDKIKRYKEILDRGNYANSKDTVDAYNECFATTKPRQSYTNCGSCLRRCILALWDAYQEHVASNETSNALSASNEPNEEAKQEAEQESIEVVEEVTDTPSKPSKKAKKKVN